MALVSHDQVKTVRASPFVPTFSTQTCYEAVTTTTTTTATATAIAPCDVHAHSVKAVEGGALSDHKDDRKDDRRRQS